MLKKHTLLTEPCGFFIDHSNESSGSLQGCLALQIIQAARKHSRHCCQDRCQRLSCIGHACSRWSDVMPLVWQGQNPDWPILILLKKGWLTDQFCVSLVWAAAQRLRICCVGSAGLWTPAQDAGHPAQAPGVRHPPAAPIHPHTCPVASLPGPLPESPGLPDGPGDVWRRLHLWTVCWVGFVSCDVETREAAL